MSKNWYIVHVFTGYENKIERTIRMMLESGELDSKVVTDVRVPVEEVTEVKKDGKKRVRKNILFSGYVYLELDLPELGWKNVCSSIRAIQGVTGFVGTAPSVRPRPLSRSEAEAVPGLMESVGHKSVAVGKNFEIDDFVKVTEGPFSGFSGKVEEVALEKNRLRVIVEIFGRATPVEVDFTQVEKIY
mgnify:CR=1 FL=1